MVGVSARAGRRAGKYLGQVWLDPFMGIVGAILVLRWAIGLLRISSRVLLDVQADEGVRRAIQAAMESQNGDKVSDLHVWSVGPGIFAAEIAVVSDAPQEAERYYALLPHDIPLAHVTIEVRRCSGGVTCGEPK